MTNNLQRTTRTLNGETQPLHRCAECWTARDQYPHWDNGWTDAREPYPHHPRCKNQEGV